MGYEEEKEQKNKLKGVYLYVAGVLSGAAFVIAIVAAAMLFGAGV